MTNVVAPVGSVERLVTIVAVDVKRALAVVSSYDVVILVFLFRLIILSISLLLLVETNNLNRFRKLSYSLT
jgi:hypothetical protein